MFDIGWLELMVIGVVALIVVGPKDLPGMFRTVGNFVGKAKGMAREFQRSMEAAADESGLKEAADTMKGLDSLGQAKNHMKDYAKNYVTQKDQKAADAKSRGDELVEAAERSASPAARSVAKPKVEAVEQTTPAKAETAKAPVKKTPAKAKAATKAAAKTATKTAKPKSPAKPKAASKAKAAPKAKS